MGSMIFKINFSFASFPNIDHSQCLASILLSQNRIITLKCYKNILIDIVCFNMNKNDGIE